MVPISLISSTILIVDFMGGKIIPDPTGEAQEGLTWYRYKDSNYCLEHGDMKFNSEWNWLMPVVIKIESITKSKKWPDAYERVNHLYTVELNNNSCIIHENIWAGEQFKINRHASSKIMATFEAILVFIEYHTNQKENI